MSESNCSVQDEMQPCQLVWFLVPFILYPGLLYVGSGVVGASEYSSGIATLLRELPRTGVCVDLTRLCDADSLIINH